MASPDPRAASARARLPTIRTLVVLAAASAIPEYRIGPQKGEPVHRTLRPAPGLSQNAGSATPAALLAASGALARLLSVSLISSTIRYRRKRTIRPLPNRPAEPQRRSPRDRAAARGPGSRSAERRVGKECRSRWSP